MELAKLFPTATIYDFEPVPVIFENLKRNVRRYKNIHCFQLALSNSNGAASMFISSGQSDASSSLQKPKDHLTDHPAVDFKEVQQVPTRTLDTWALENNIQAIDFLWLDMQGHEYEMLYASPQILSTVRLIHTEVSVKETYENALTYAPFKQWLESKGFKALIEAIPPGSDMGNVLFIKLQ